MHIAIKIVIGTISTLVPLVILAAGIYLEHKSKTLRDSRPVYSEELSRISRFVMELSVYALIIFGLGFFALAWILNANA